MTLVGPRPERPAFLRRVREAHSRLELSHFSEARAQRPRAGEGRLWPFAEGESCTRLVAEHVLANAAPCDAVLLATYPNTADDNFGWDDF